MVDYKYYTENYGGNLVLESDWKRIARKAETKLHEYTYGRLKKITNKERTVICELADCMYEYGKRDGVSSETTDGYSVSYDVSTKSNSQLYDIVKATYIHTGLLYCGVKDVR